MTRRSFDDSFWGDTFVQELDYTAKYLFIYLWTNKRCNSAGLYEITLKTIHDETDLEYEQLPGLFKKLEKRIVRIEDDNIIWVKNFLKHQPKSPQFLKSVAACLQSINSNGIIKDFIAYYSLMGVSIPYTNGIDTVSKPYGYILEPELELEQEQEIDKEPDNTDDGKALKKYPPEYTTYRKQVFNLLKERRGYTSRQPAAEAKAISQMLAEDFTPEQIVKAYDLMKDQPFFRDKNLSMMQVRKDIHEVLKNGADRQVNKPDGRSARNNEPDKSRFTSGKYGSHVQQ